MAAACALAPVREQVVGVQAASPGSMQTVSDPSAYIIQPGI